MTRDFEPLSEVELDQEAFGDGQFVNIGWGAKETQFHGSEGKAAALASKQTTPLVAVDDSADDGRARAVWRDDGQGGD